MAKEKKKKPKFTPSPLGQETVATKKVKTAHLNLTNPKPKVPGVRLNIGSGGNPKKNFLNVDLYDKRADAMWDAKNIPLNDESIAQIVCYQTLEHIPQNDLLPTLKEFYRVLKPGGNAVLVVPDMVGACERFLADPEDDWALARIYGNQIHDGQFHKSGFTSKKIFTLLAYAGFGPIAIAYFEEPNKVKSIYAEATK